MAMFKSCPSLCRECTPRLAGPGPPVHVCKGSLNSVCKPSLALSPAQLSCTAGAVWHRQPIGSQDVSCGPIASQEIIIFHPPGSREGLWIWVKGSAQRMGEQPCPDRTSHSPDIPDTGRGTGLLGLSCFWMPILRNWHWCVQKYRAEIFYELVTH